MKTILLVDDERTFLLSLRDGLRSLGKEFGILLAGDGREAIELLGTQKIDLLVTDLKLPRLDGFELLAHVSSFHPDLPVIVMTAYGTPEMEERLAQMQALHYLEKPLELDQLAETIDTALSRENLSYIRGITLATFLQLMNMEQKTCTLKIHSGDRTGYLFIIRGEILDAKLESASGKDAALEIIAWDDTEIEMDTVCRRTEQVIEEPFSYLLMEAHRLKDERPAATPPPVPADESPQPVIPLRRSPPPSAGGDSALPHDLIRRLENLPTVKEYALFNEANFLEHQKPVPSSLAELNPSFLILTGEALGDTLNAGTMQYLLLSTAPRQKYLAFRSGRHKVFAHLAPSARLADVLEELFRQNAHVFTQGGLDAADYR